MSRLGPYLRGARAGVPIGVSIFAVGVAFGVFARSLGWGLFAPTVMSLAVFSGSAQFAVAGVVADGGSTSTALVAALLINARFIPMGIASASSLRGGRVRRAVEGQAVVDAGWALANNHDGTFDREFLLGFFAAMVPAWIGGTWIGALVGNSFGDLNRFGLDVVFPAFFLALLDEELRESRVFGLSILAGLVALALIPVTPAGIPVLAASALALRELVDRG
jgi:4-azaleucine resistance transporter AzlC